MDGRREVSVIGSYGRKKEIEGEKNSDGLRKPSLTVTQTVTG